jgi:protein-tyrosine-phosphatase
MNNQSVNHQERASYSEFDQPRESSFILKLDEIWNSILNAVFASDRPRIYLLKDRSGSTYWKIHDPRLGHRIFASETEVRAWLDRRYYN